MKLTANGKFVFDIDEESFKKVLTIYPDESLYERAVFLAALDKGIIRYEELIEECRKLQIPWQMFFLNEANLDDTLSGLESLRKSKFDSKQIATRRGTTGSVSMRIADRLIKIQQFVTAQIAVKNLAPGMLRGRSIQKSAETVINFLEFDVDKFRGKTKEKALAYLIESVERNNIYV